MIQISSGHQILVPDVKDPSHLIGHFRTLVDALIRTQTHLELQELAEPFDIVQVNARLFVQKQMANFAHFALNAQVLGQHAIQHIRLGHIDNVEFGQFSTGQVWP